MSTDKAMVTDAMVEAAAKAACEDNVDRIHRKVNERGGSNSMSGSEFYAYPPTGWPDFLASMRAALSAALAQAEQPVAWPMVQTCQCEFPMVKYGARRVACEICGLPPGLAHPPAKREAGETQPPVPHVGSIVPPHCSGSALAFDPGVLHVNKDGSGYIAINEEDFILEDDRDGEGDGSIHWIARMDASELIALRDFLNGVPAPVSNLSGWQDISTAPKNTKVLAAYRNELYNWRIVTACYHTQLEWSDEYGDHEQEYAPEDWYEENDSSEIIYPCSRQPTHWQPLPAPPATTEGSTDA